MKATHPFQFLIRVDVTHQRLVYDVTELNASIFDAVMPTRREVNRGCTCIGFDHCNLPFAMDEPMDVKVLTKNGLASYLCVQLQALVGKYFNTRMFRVAMPLENIVGVRLHVPAGSGDHACLILELDAYPTAEAKSFAVRKVSPAHGDMDSFASVPDWTPDQSASRSQAALHLWLTN